MRKTLEQLFREFIYECEFVKKVKPETLRGYVQTFNLFNKIMPAANINTISTDALISFFKTLHERKRIVGKGVVKVGVQKSTIATYWSKLSVFFEWLAVKKHIRTNPLRQLRHPSPVYQDRKYLKKEEIEKIITAIHTHHNNNILLLKRNVVLLHLLLFCGLRKGELMSLQVRDIDFERRSVTIRGDTSKSGKTREIPLHSSVMMYLKDYFSARKTYTTPYVIVSSNRDEKLTDNGLKHLIDKLKLNSGVSFHVHQLRHTFAINFLKTSNNIAKLKQLLGHKNISMTMIYLRCLPTDELRGDVENMSIDTLI